MSATATVHPAAPHNLPAFITEPGHTDVLFVAMALFLLFAVLSVGLLFLRLHTLPERMAHKSQKLQFEIVAVLGLIALFTHEHIFWIAGLILALIDLPDFGSPLGRIAHGVETMAGIKPTPDVIEREEGIEPRRPGHHEAAPPASAAPRDVHVAAPPKPVHGG
jgi:hypothetical protein